MSPARNAKPLRVGRRPMVPACHSGPGGRRYLHRLAERLAKAGIARPIPVRRAAATFLVA